MIGLRPIKIRSRWMSPGPNLNHIDFQTVKTPPSRPFSSTLSTINPNNLKIFRCFPESTPPPRWPPSTSTLSKAGSINPQSSHQPPLPHRLILPPPHRRAIPSQFLLPQPLQPLQRPPKPDPKKTIGSRAGKARILHPDAGAVLLGMRERPDYSQEEVRENERFWKEFRESPVVKFLAQAEKIAGMVNELELKENDRPYRDEDKKLWQAVPRVIGPDGRPMPRKAIKTGRSRLTSYGILQGSSFLDFGGSASGPTRRAGLLTLLRLSGISGSKSSIMIVIIMRNGGFYYEGRLGRTRAPLELITLKTAWGAGIIDKDTFIWGEDMDEWAPIHMVYGLEPLLLPLGKGHEKKTYKQLQEEAVESKRRDLAVLEANDGFFVFRDYNIFTKLGTRVYQKLELTIPGFDKIMENVHADATARDARRKARREAEMKAEQEKALGIQSDP
ncbi:hypothetical protein C1H46_020107 [Malus baccata]|uniref:GYF domain-containing protein n=1 Tax=Malus baccata TaxID=106549 RepID=A0A540M6B7_MALBA|nr:hypothetical protein C1H46_020107 [Malus baccata]